MQSREGLLQTRAPASKGIQAKGPIEVCREPLKTRAHADLHKMVPTDKVTLQTKGPYIQGVSTDKGALQTRGHHRQEVYTDKGPPQQITLIDDV